MADMGSLPKSVPLHLHSADRNVAQQWPRRASWTSMCIANQPGVRPMMSINMPALTLHCRVAGRMGYTSATTVAELEAGVAPAGTYVLPSWEQTALTDQPEKVLVCGWGETAFMCRSGHHGFAHHLAFKSCI